MQINLIRHGKTKGNEEKRYIGRTDEPLCESGADALRKNLYPDCDILLVSPMLRCRQSAKIIYPDKEALIIDDFRECDFGIFEGHNYQELSSNPLYQSWIDSNGTLDFPEGESVDGFKRRTVEAFKNALDSLQKHPLKQIKENETPRLSIVAHGGTIMALLEYYEKSHDYYKWQIENAGVLIFEFTGKEMREMLKNA